MLLFLAAISSSHAEDLSVSSNLRGAAILIDGVDTGFRTPAVISGLAPGKVLVAVQDQCQSGEAFAEIAAGKANRVTVAAEEKLATLLVKVDPPQALVDVNRGQIKLSPNVPVGLSCGTYEIAATLKGYSSVSYSLELTGGQELTLPITLDKLGMSTVEISVKPSTAAIYFDDQEMGKDAVSLPSVYEGEHTLGAKLKGYNDVVSTIVVSDGDDLVFSIELARGDNDSEVAAVGGAGKAALSEGAKVVMARRPAGAAVQEKDDEADPKLVDKAMPDEEEEPAVARTKVVEPEEEEELAEEPEEPEDDGAAADEDDLDDAPPEASEPKSWSELHAADDPKSAKTATRSERDSDSGARSTATVTEKRPKAGLRAAGGTLLAVGALVGGGGGAYTYLEAGAAWTIYTDKDTAAKNAEDADAKRRLSQQAQDYYTTEFEPKATLMYGTIAAGSVLAATGVLLLVVDANGPIVLPTPDGGALIGWAASF